MSANAIIGRQRRFNRWRSPVSLGDIARLIACCLVLLMPLLSLEIAGWPIDLNIVLPVLVIGVVIGIFAGGQPLWRIDRALHQCSICHRQHYLLLGSVA